ncbi:MULTISPECIES: TnsA endonuclease N-terminal domain-containing protein [Bacillus]|uniref:TnsA endonuclease N-terminal domain-containing protein n=1 Tax=Bacillus TaxID=1386 RepID=UPI0005E4133C|nr:MULTISPECIES: TnsA endonuclease N-terminal domain-containing protein [Bacillus]MED2869651.1 TnsA endonuclease N-terminal domain-containing protein [Bacillus thuringiensis]ONG80898.1 transposase [Bacillus cereus]COE84004.1 Transposon Tn7 transposition protein tnsA [Streptococcus pneumoniae]MCU5096021.1 TnsA endonuclease N-terminal domain-containing protein [Bacillus wiedmannii]MDX6047350.1 TnsA endonuclease N-terminal domain-containing protein [Bacillus paranthracis]
MAKRKYEWDAKKIERYIKQGRGQKEGKNYKPWFLAQDVPSIGRDGQREGWKTGRDHHLLSDLESDYFYLLEWSSTVTDIREQFPLLPIEETVSIAEGLGIKHPNDNKTKEIVVMTTDFVINVGSKEFVRTLKYAGDLEDARTIEKLEIEREYWQRRNIDWGIVTDKEIPKILCENVKWVRKEYHNSDVSKLGSFIVDSIEKIVYQLIQDETTPLSIATSQTDDRLGLEPGTSLAMIRHFIARKRWIVNMNEKIIPSLPLKGVLISTNSNYKKAEGYQ